MYGTGATDLGARLENQHEGVRRVLRSVSVTTTAVAVLALIVALSGNTSAAGGIVALMFAPLCVVLAGVGIVAWLTRPKGPRR